MPVITYASLEEVPEGLKEYAKQTDGKFAVEVVPGAKLTEFRDNNVALSKQRDDLAGVMTKLKPVIGESVEEFLARHAELTVTAQKVKDGSLKASDAIEAEVTNRVATMKTGYETQLAQANAERAAAQQAKAEADARFNQAIVARAVTDAVVDASTGANPGALEDILTRASRIFTVTPGGQLIAKDGDAIIYGADGATPMTPKEWLVKLRGSASYLFKSSSGGGANGGNTKGGVGGGNLSAADVAKMTPAQKLDYAHKLKALGKK